MECCVLKAVTNYGSQKFKNHGFDNFGVKLASLLNPRPHVGPASDQSITLFRDLSDQVY